jgi:hypothetical protein
MNPEIKKLHQNLIQTHLNLAARLGETDDIEDALAILREMDEVNFRVMMAGKLLFQETTARIDQRIDGVLAASGDLDQSLKEIEKTKDLIKAVGKFLTLVDKVIDAIKVLGI